MDYDDDGQFEAFSSTMSEERISCDICGRKFNPNALDRHRPICAKNTTKQRKAFDSSKQRADGSEIPAAPKHRTTRAPARREPPPKKSNWRAKHQDFINTIRAARGVQAAIDSGGPLPPPPPPTINPDYDQCPYCERRFNSSAAERHIPFCKEQHARKQITAKKQDAQSKMKTRTQYRVPKPQTRGSSGHSGGSSLGVTSNRMHGSSTSPGARPNKNGSAKSRSQTTSFSAPPKGSSMRNSHSMNGLSRGYGDGYDAHDGSVSPGSGKALRTGRTPEGYSDARDVGAKAKVEALSKKFPSNDSIHKSSYNRMEIYEDLDEEKVRHAFDRNQSSKAPPRYLQSSKYSGYGSPSPEPLRRPPSGSRKTRGHESSYHHGDHPHHDDHPGGGGGGGGGGGRARPGGSGVGRFCHDCGTKYPIAQAKFCCECGMKRIVF